jgi:hypothetical protein
MCRPHPAADIADADHTSTTADDWLAFWTALIALELADFEGRATTAADPRRRALTTDLLARRFLLQELPELRADADRRGLPRHPSSRA